MAKDVRVLIVEDDLYSRDMMTMLLTRDWRTRVVGEIDGHEDVSDYLLQPLQQVDVILIGVETPTDQEWPFQMLDLVDSYENPTVILYAGTRFDKSVLAHASRKGFGGYLLKDEVIYSLASAVVFASKGHCVITPGVKRIANEIDWPQKTLVIDGSQKVTNFSKRESEIVHLGILFNLAQRDIADELVIGTDWVSEAMSNVYEKLGLREILSGEVPLNLYFDDEMVLAHCERILERAQRNSSSGSLRRAPWMSTLAFHLLTAPTIEEI